MSNSVGCRYGSIEWRERVGAGVRRALARKKELALLRPRDLDRLKSSGSIAPQLRPLLRIAEEECVELLEALGGLDTVTPQKRIIVEDLVAVGIGLRAEHVRFLQTADPEAASRMGSLAGVRRAGLLALGLTRASRDVSLHSYLEAKTATASQPTAGARSDSTPPEPAQEALQRTKEPQGQDFPWVSPRSWQETHRMRRAHRRAHHEAPREVPRIEAARCPARAPRVEASSVSPWPWAFDRVAGPRDEGLWRRQAPALAVPAPAAAREARVVTASDTRVAALLAAWRKLTPTERSAFLVRAWQERWPMPATSPAAEVYQKEQPR